MSAPGRARRGAPATRTVGVDTGGTFTDLVAVEGGRTTVHKVPSTPDDPSRAVLEALERPLGPAPVGGRRAVDLARTRVVHGTTVGLNALLQHAQAPTALVTNEGFRDLLEIGRQDRPELYALHPVKPAAVVPRELRFELPQRSWPDPERAPGEGSARLVCVRAPTAEELRRLVARVRGSGARAVAVCLLHSWADPSIERRVAEALSPLGLPVTCSSELVREFREVERFSTAAVNASLVPLMRAYLRRLVEALPGARLELLQSSGGTLAASAAADEPVRVLLSGPAGGTVGAARAAHQAGFDALVGLDIGGTSADVSFRGTDGTSGDRFGAARIAGHAVAVPSLDIHTIGCGGGSLVTVDAGGVLRVGPESAGADPGPACYGRGELPTVTDAHVVLGHLAPEGLLGGELALDAGASQRAFERLAARLGSSPRAAAAGALEVARAAMRRAVGVMTMQRGQDPARLPLVGFGGAGGLHAAALARALGMAAAVVPADPGVLSALGMTTADALREVSETVLAPLAALGAARRRRMSALARAARAELRTAGHPPAAIEVEVEADLRYEGQAFELRVPDDGGSADALAAAFHRRHEELYGYRLERPVELVTLRARALVRAPLPRRARAPERTLPAEATVGERGVVFDGTPARTRVVDRHALRPGHAFEGPAVVQEYTATTLVPPGVTARVTAGGHLALTR